jgi:hypothetical protein
MGSAGKHLREGRRRGGGDAAERLSRLAASIPDTFVSMGDRHLAAHALVRLGDTHPESVDALVLACLQLEGLYNLSLIVRLARLGDTLSARMVDAPVHALDALSSCARTTIFLVHHEAIGEGGWQGLSLNRRRRR